MAHIGSAHISKIVLLTKDNSSSSFVLLRQVRMKQYTAALKVETKINN